MKKNKISPNAELRVISILIMLGNYKNILAQKAMLRLTDDCFYNPINKILFRIIKNQFDNHNPFDSTTILDLMLSETKEVSDHCHNIVAKDYGSSANFDSYIEDLIHAEQLRNQILISNRMLNDCLQAHSFEESSQAINDGIKAISEIHLNKSKDGSTLAEIGERYFEGHYDFDTIPTNIPFLDKSLEGGIKNSCLLTICGDTGTGKTYFALYLMYKIGNHNPDKQSLYFNLEMAEQHNYKRLLGIALGKPYKSLTYQEKIKAHTKIVQHPVTIFEEKHNDINDIITLARVKSLQNPLSVIVVDYISLVETKEEFGRNDLEQVSIAKRLASLAIELNCIVIATSQTNRNPSNRNINDRCPYMSDASDSSGNYKSAEIWIGIDRPELYNDDPAFKNKFIAKIRKNRNGLLFNAAWDFNTGTFGEIDSNKFLFAMANTDKKSNNFDMFSKGQLSYLTRKDDY